MSERNFFLKKGGVECECFVENANDAAQREESTLYFWYCFTTCLHLSAGCVYVYGRGKP